MNELHLFAGAGGGILGGILLGHTTVCAVEIEPYCRQVLLQRQRDGILPRFPIWDDVKTFDGRPWRGRVDVVCGGFPCQDISAAGAGKGIEGTRSGLWSEFVRIIGEVQPRFVFVENSPMLTIRGLGRVLGDLATMGHDARWGVFGSNAAGGCQKRERIWIVAHYPQGRRIPGVLPAQKFCQEPFDIILARVRESLVSDENLPADIRKHYEMAGWMDRLAAAGNGQDPAVVRLAWEVLRP